MFQHGILISKQIFSILKSLKRFTNEVDTLKRFIEKL